MLASSIITLMYTAVILIVLFIFGAVFGSFAGAQVWRLRLRQLIADKRDGYDYDKADLKKLKKVQADKLSDDRSRCLACGHTLGLRDLIPLISWAATKGRCRYCREPIGSFEPSIEIFTGVVFILSYLWWPWGSMEGLSWILFAVWLLIVVGLVILFAYDARWKILPDVVNFTTTGLALLFVILRLWLYDDISVLSMVGAIGILSGLYALIYIVSRGKWIGLGDVKLGVALGLLLADWQLAFLGLFLANLIGCLAVLPVYLSRQLTSNSQIAFGPMLIAGTMIAFFFGPAIIEWFLNIRFI